MPPRCLHDSAIAPAEQATKLGQPVMQAAVCQPIVLRAIAAIETRKVTCVVARRRLRESRRGHRIVLASGTYRLLVLAGVCRLQQGEAIFPIGSSSLLGRRCERRNPAIGRIDNQRCARAGVLYGQKRRVVGTADVNRGPAILTGVAAEMCSSLLVQFLPLRRGEKFLVRIPGGALQRRIKFVSPNSLQVRFTPRCFQRRAGSRRRLS